jgi:hypothetical protein
LKLGFAMWSHELSGHPHLGDEVLMVSKEDCIFGTTNNLQDFALVACQQPNIGQESGYCLTGGKAEDI